MDLTKVSSEQLVAELEGRLQLVPYSLLQQLASAAEIEMINRTMPETAYAED